MRENLQFGKPATLGGEVVWAADTAAVGEGREAEKFRFWGIAEVVK